MNNQDIWLAYPALIELSRLIQSGDTAQVIARNIKALQSHYYEIEHSRRELARKYGIRKPGDAFNCPEYIVESSKILSGESDVEIEPFEIPDKVIYVYAGGRQVEVPFLCKPGDLAPLTEHIV